MSKKDHEEARSILKELCLTVDPVQDVMDQFKSDGATQSATFAIWSDYLAMVEILLNFIRAEREGRWNLHLNTVAQMLPYFFAYDHTNYARWATIYLADMRQLEETAPQVHGEFEAGNFTVKRSTNQFNQVWSDMALEQSINRDSKTRGGLIGITQKPAALARWFLTAHKRAEITTATKSMCGMEIPDTAGGPHKESGVRRLSRDERDVQAVVDTITGRMINPFRIETPDDGHAHLVTISTGRVASVDTENDMLNARTIEMEAMELFVDDRLQHKKLSVFD